VELDVATVTEKDAVPPDDRLREDWLVLTTGGLFELVASVAVTLTEPVR
jgi:hypothetical protein